MEHNYERLAHAIIIKACDDYRSCCKKLKKHPLNFDAKHTKKECLAFFRGTFFSGITDLDPELLIGKLNEEVGCYES